MDERPIILSIQNIGKKYVIKHRNKFPHDGTMLQKVKYRLKSQEKEDFWALKDINFEVKKGERVAILGRNGAGKSTLLKLISRITEPTEGRIEYTGDVAAMLEVGTGFNIELTGRENVYLNGSILGMSKEEIDEKFDGIVEFAEIEKFIDTPVKRYSSGMTVRLAFAVASTMNPDILIVDEVLSVGDMRFRTKCLKRMAEIASNDHTIICVSHVMNIVRGLCDRAIVLENGKMIFDGDIEEGIKIYNGVYKIARSGHYDHTETQRQNGYFCDRLVIRSIDILDNEDCLYEWNEPIKFKLNVKALTDETDISMRVCFWRDDGTTVSTAFFPPFISFKKGDEKDIYVEIEKHNLAPGDYKASLTLSKGQPYDTYDNIDSVSPEAFFISVMNIANVDEEAVRDDTARFWQDAWGKSRISDTKINKIITNNTESQG